MTTLMHLTRSTSTTATFTSIPTSHLRLSNTITSLAASHPLASASASIRPFSTITRIRRYARGLLARTTPEATKVDREIFMTGIKPKFKYTPEQQATRTYPLRKVWRRREFIKLLESSSFVLVVDFGELMDMTRKAELRKAYPNIHFFESKNSIFRQVVEGTPYAGVAGLLAGPCTMLYAKNPATVVEDLVTVFDMLEANPSWALFGGIIEKSLVTVKDLERIKSYGTTPAVTSSVIPQLQSSTHQLFRTLQSSNHLLFRILQSRVKTLQGESGAPASASASTSAPTDAESATSTPPPETPAS